jgi:hypothetical protein
MGQKINSLMIDFTVHVYFRSNSISALHQGDTDSIGKLSKLGYIFVIIGKLSKLGYISVIVYIPANFPDSGGIFPISTILPDFPIGIFKILNFPNFLSLSPVLRQSTTNCQHKVKIPCHFVTPAN